MEGFTTMNASASLNAKMRKKLDKKLAAVVERRMRKLQNTGPRPIQVTFDKDGNPVYPEGWKPSQPTSPADPVIRVCFKKKKKKKQPLQQHQHDQVQRRGDSLLAAGAGGDHTAGLSDSATEDKRCAYTRLMEEMAAASRGEGSAGSADSTPGPVIGSKVISHPAPGKIDIPSPEDFAPLSTWLQNGDAPKTPEVFNRGVALPDGRLDLCKQGVGPGGISRILEGLERNDHVSSVLLGNNFIGDKGARCIASYLAKRAEAASHATPGRSSGASLPPPGVSVWYVACNYITSDGLRDLLDAMHRPGTTPVTQLWIKRNPLRASGARLLANMIAKTPTLTTLDVVNTALMDEGVSTLLRALQGLNSIRHLYIGGNGVSPGSGVVADLTSLLTTNTQLQSLHLACTPLLDAGATAIAEALPSNRSLVRLDLSSCGIQVEGAKCLARIFGASFAGLEDCGAGSAAAVTEPTDSTSGRGTVSSVLRVLMLGHAKSEHLLGVPSNALTDEGIAAFASALCHPDCPLLSLNVEDRTWASADSIETLARAMEVNHMLQALNYYYVRKRHVFSADDCRSIRAALKRNQDLAAGNLEVANILSPPHLACIKSVYR